MLAYANINLLSMLSRYTPDEVVRVATDSIYIQKTLLHKFEGVEAYYVAPKRCNCGGAECILCIFGEPFLPPVAPAQWRDKGEKVYMPMEHALCVVV
ncbi:MAG: hypothetical protein AB2556_26340 [Candidatus Thiodiazotropha sp.]